MRRTAGGEIDRPGQKGNLDDGATKAKDAQDAAGSDPQEAVSILQGLDALTKDSDQKAADLGLVTWAEDSSGGSTGGSSS